MVKSRRSRVAATPGSSGISAGQSAPANTGSHLKRGADASKQAQHEAEQARKKGHLTWRFWLANEAVHDPSTVTEECPQGMMKNEAELIILDATLNDIVGQHEHNLRIGGKYGNFEGCVKEWDNCALCDSGDKSYYVVFFSVLVLKPWKSKDGKKSGGWTKMLLPIKSAQLGKFEELCQAAQDAHDGVLRGTYFYMKRDTSNAQSPGTGEPVVLDGGIMFDHYSEEELVRDFGSAAEKSPEGKLLKPENEDITAIDYDKEFEKPDADSLRSRFGHGHQPGSQGESAEEWGERSTEEEPTEPPKRTGRRRPPPPSTPETTEATEEDDNLPSDTSADGPDPFEGENK